MAARPATSRSVRPLPPSAIVEQQAVAAAARQRRRGRRSTAVQISHASGSCAAQRRHIVAHPRCRAAGPRAGPSIVAMSATTRDRRVAEHADRQHPGLRASAGQRRGFRAVTWRGLPGTNTKPAKAAGRAARDVRAAIQAAQFDAAEDQLARRLRPDRRRASATMPTRKPSTMRRQAARRRRASRCRIRETSMRSGASGASRSVVARSMRKVAQVAVVDADQRRAERERAAHLGFVMDLDQRVHAEPARLGDHRRAPRRRRAATASPASRRRRRSRASATWRGSMKKSLARIGPSNSPRAAARSSSEPPK